MLDLIRQRAQSWGVKIAFGIIIIVFVFWGVGTSTRSAPGVFATVNGRPILLKEFQQAVSAQQNQIRAAIPDISQDDMRAMQIPQQVLQMMVSRALIEQEAARIGMTVTPLELLKYLSPIPAFHGPDGKFNQAAYEKAVAAQGNSVPEFEQRLMRDLLGNKMRLAVSSAVTATPEEARRRFGFQMERRTMSYVPFSLEAHRQGVAVGEEAIEAYYKDNQPQFLEPASTALAYVDVTTASLAASMPVEEARVEAAYAQGPLRYNLRQLGLDVPDGADEAREKEIRAKLEETARAIQGGKDFAEAAREISGDASPAAGDVGWVPARQLTPEILGALAGLGKGAVTAPLRTGKSFSLLQLVETDPDWTLPEAEIKAALRAALAEEDAALALRDVQAQAEDLVDEGKPLAEISQALKVASKTTALTTRENLAFVLGLRKPGQASLFEGEKGSLVSAILETREGFVVAEIAEQKPAGIKPLAEARDTISDILIRREAEKRAEEAARKALAAFGKEIPAEYRAEIVTTEPFGRQGDIPGIGFAKGLTDAVFAAPLNQWLKDPYVTPTGVVVAMPVEAVSLKDEDWTKIEARLTASLLESKQSQAFTAFLADLGKNAKVAIVEPRALEE
ncbi:MAG: SurA N-terminal domain-containing protein [Deltaproteobacteria bacterium]|nr:SurA N-terminal domain-containing protein [Deltaproteobacteria bacterium]